LGSKYVHIPSIKPNVFAKNINELGILNGFSCDNLEIISDRNSRLFKSSTFLERLPYVLNTGIGKDYSVMDFYKKVLTALNLDISITLNSDMPNGNYRKLMDSSIARDLGWNPNVDIDEGINSTIKWYLANRLAI
jgi:hypothetical protein